MGKKNRVHAMHCSWWRGETASSNKYALGTAGRERARRWLPHPAQQGRTSPSVIRHACASTFISVHRACCARPPPTSAKVKTLMPVSRARARICLWMSSDCTAEPPAAPHVPGVIAYSDIPHSTESFRHCPFWAKRCLSRRPSQRACAGSGHSTARRRPQLHPSQAVAVPVHVRLSSHLPGRARRVDGDRDCRRLERGQRRLEGALQPRLGLRARGRQHARPARPGGPACGAAEASRRRTRSKLISRLAAGPRACCVGARVPALCSVLKGFQTQATACRPASCVLPVLCAPNEVASMLTPTSQSDDVDNWHASLVPPENEEAPHAIHSLRTVQRRR